MNCRRTVLARAETTIALVACAWWIGSARAETAATAAPAPASPVFGMMQGLVGLVIVVGCIYAAAWALRKMGPRTRSSGIVQVMGGASVGPREKVVVVRFAGRTLLLGVAPGQVSLLHAGEVGDAVDPPADTPAPTFRERLRTVRGDA